MNRINAETHTGIPEVCQLYDVIGSCTPCCSFISILIIFIEFLIPFDYNN